MQVVHSITLPSSDVVCAADREHGLIHCFSTENGTYIRSLGAGGKEIFAIKYCPAKGIIVCFVLFI